MTRVHAFGDDALGDLDAVGLVGADPGRAGRRSPRSWRPRSPGPSGSTPAQRGRPPGLRPGAGARPASPRGGFFAGVPTLRQGQRRRRGHAHPARQRRLRRPAAAARRRLRPDVPGHRAGAAGQDPALGVRLQPLGRAPPARAGALARGTPTAPPGASSAGSAALVAAGAVPLAHANDGGGSIRIPASVNGLVGLKPTRDRLAQDRMMRDMPVRIVSDGVLTRSVRDTAAFLREAEQVYRALHLPPVGDITRPGRARLRVAVVTERRRRRGLAGGRRADARDRAAAGGARPPRRAVDPPVPSAFADDFLLYWALLALRVGPHRPPRARPPRGTRPARQPHPRASTAHAAATCTGCPSRSRGCGGSAGCRAALFRDLRRRAHARRWPRDPAGRAPRPDPGLRHRDGRILDWVAFTPLQNATGDPAVSLPLATTAAGLPQGMMFAPGRAVRRRSWSSPTSSRRPVRGPGSRPDPELAAVGGGADFRSPQPLCILSPLVAPLAQSAERLHGKEKVYGSIP